MCKGLKNSPPGPCTRGMGVWAQGEALRGAPGALTPVSCGKERPPASILHTPGPFSGDSLLAVGGGAGCSRLHSHGRSEQSPGVANSGHGQLCSGAEAVISGPENSCPEWAPRRAVIFPRGPSWPCATSPSKVQGCEEPPGMTKTSRSVAGRRPHLGRLGPPAWGGPFRALCCSWRRAPGGSQDRVVTQLHQESWK